MNTYLLQQCSVLRGLALAALLFALPAGYASAGSIALQDQGELKTLRVLLAIDTASDDLEKSVKVDKDNMLALLRKHIPADRLKIDVVEGKNLTRTRVLQYYREQKVGPDEALLFYYAGHGAWDPAKGYCMVPQKGRVDAIPRKELRKAMVGTRASLVVILTDCCSTIRKLNSAGSRRTEDIAHKAFHPVVRSLFFRHRGVVDITSAQLNAFAVGDDDRGGLFTDNFKRLIESKTATNMRSWAELMPVLSHRTESSFKEWVNHLPRGEKEQIKQTTQRPNVFSVGVALRGPTSEAPKNRFAVVALTNSTGEALCYRYRWEGETEWKSGELADGTTGFHFVLLKEDTPALPQLEVQAKIKDDEGSARLDANEWTGDGNPTAKDGATYAIKSDKK